MLQGLMMHGETGVALSAGTRLDYWPTLGGQGSWRYTNKAGALTWVTNGELQRIVTKGRIAGVLTLSGPQHKNLTVWFDQQLENGNWRIEDYDRSAALQESAMRKRHWRAAAEREFPPGTKVAIDDGYEPEDFEPETEYTVVDYDVGSSGDWPYLVVAGPRSDRRYIVDHEVAHRVEDDRPRLRRT